MTDDELTERLERIERELAVRRLIDRYANACDTNDAALAASLFGDGGELVVRGVTRTGDEIKAFYAERFTLPTLHFMTGLTMTERADGSIDATCGLFALESPADGSRGLFGRYVDVVRVTDGNAEFVRREIVVNGRVGGSST